jgi:hypothetical protein
MQLGGGTFPWMLGLAVAVLSWISVCVMAKLGLAPLVLGDGFSQNHVRRNHGVAVIAPGFASAPGEQMFLVG